MDNLFSQNLHLEYFASRPAQKFPQSHILGPIVKETREAYIKQNKSNTDANRSSWGLFLERNAKHTMDSAAKKANQDLMNVIRQQQATFFGHIMRREGLEHLNTARELEV